MSFQFSQFNEPGTPETSDPQALQVCPHLGLFDDPALVLTEPSDNHRCFARTRPSLPGFEHQETYCLRSEHVRCPYYKAQSEIPNIAPSTSPFSEPFRNELNSDGQNQRRRWPALLVALIGATILGVGALYAGDSINSIRLPAVLLPIIERTGLLPGGATATLEAIAEVPTVGPVATGTPTVEPKPTEEPPSATAQVTVAPTKSTVSATTPEATSIIPEPTATSAVTEEVSTALLTEYVEPTPVPGGAVFSLTPPLGNAGWWQTNDRTRNHLNDSFLYAGVNEGQSFISAIRFELGKIPRGAEIVGAELRLTGLRDDRFDPAVKGTWIVQLVAESELRNLVRSDYLELYTAPASIILFPQLSEQDLSINKVNSWQLDESTRRWLEQQIFNGATTVIVRIQATTNAQADSLFAWDSGLGPESLGNPPILTLSLGQAPATPPATVTKDAVVATLTPTPENVLTEVALAATATEVATTIGTYTPIPFDVVTPTPVARSVETAQAIALEMNELPVVVETATPGNEATATAYMDLATAIAQTTGTYTPVPFPYNTPVLVLPSPPAENVATLAAQVATATADASIAISETATPLPYNAVLADYVYATEQPQNRATAQAMVILATAEAQTTGTPTSLPWNAVVITRVPTPRPRNATGETTDQASGEATPTVPAPISIEDVRNKIVYRRSGDKGDEVWVYDPATGQTGQAANSQIMPVVEGQLGVAPDGRIAYAEHDDKGGFQIAVRNTDGKAQVITSLQGASYDAAWSPKGDQIAFVSNESGDEEIYVISPDGQNLRRLTNSLRFDKHPTWSPDGSLIVFYSTRTGKNQLWIMNADGSNQRPLKESDASEFDPTWVR
ncbi:MAG: hypothetical protein U0175_32275 [Caldilineaceae bacterium]